MGNTFSASSESASPTRTRPKNEEDCGADHGKIYRLVVGILLLFSVATVGCVYVAEHGTYQRTDTVNQAGTNRLLNLDVNP